MRGRDEFDRGVSRLVAGYLRVRGMSYSKIGDLVGISPATAHTWTKGIDSAEDVAAILSEGEGAVINGQLDKKRLTDRVVFDSLAAVQLMNSEGLFVELYGKDLIRKRKGCDFKDPDTNILIEIKTGVLSHEQATEIISEYYDDQRRSMLVIMRDEAALVFRLETILVRMPISEPSTT